jgi:putative two-component system response regulator
VTGTTDHCHSVGVRDAYAEWVDEPVGRTGDDLVSVSAPSLIEDAEGPSVRALLDEARRIEDAQALQARAMVQRARVIARANSDEAGEAEALYRLAGASYADGQAHDAFGIAMEARDLAHRCGAIVVEVWALNLVGIIHYNAGNFSEALASTLRALELYRTTDHRIDEGNVLNTLAVIYHSLGDLDRAIVTYEAALTANKGLDRPEMDAIALANMAKVRFERRESLLAVSLGESALELAREHLPAYVPDILARLAEAYSSLNALEHAQTCIADADAIIAERHARRAELSPSSAIAVRLARAKVLIASGEPEQAAIVYEEAVVLATEATLPEPALQAHHELADLYRSMGQFEQALVHQEARFEMNQELFNRGTDLRIKTLQIAHDAEAARSQAEILRLRTGELDQLVHLRTVRLERSHIEAFQRLADIVDHPMTGAGLHTVRVGDLAGEIACALDLDPAWAAMLSLSARLHDIGKVAVPEAIRRKAGALTPEEYDVIKTHTTIGHEILSGSGSPSLDLAAEVALGHHERWDGEGYPHGVAGVDIPVSARIVTVADVFDALISVRSYKEAWSVVDAVRYVLEAKGTRFEPRIVDAFAKAIIRRDPSLAALLEQPADPQPWMPLPEP